MIKIVSDTIPNLPKDVVDKYDIELIPVYVTFGTETVRDYFDITSSEFYERLEDALDLPFTNQPSVSDFEKKYKEILKEHPDATILSIHISNLLSGTIQSGRQAAAKMPDADIRLFDTLNLGVGHGLMLVEAGKMVQAGEEADAILERLKDMRDNMKYFMVLDTLEYLQASGRIGRAARFLGSILDIKPILTLKEGAVDDYERHRTMERGREALKRIALTSVQRKKGVRLGISHSAAEEAANKLLEELKQNVEPEELLVTELGPSTGVHLGPGTLGVAWYIPKEHRKE